MYQPYDDWGPLMKEVQARQKAKPESYHNLVWETFLIVLLLCEFYMVAILLMSF